LVDAVEKNVMVSACGRDVVVEGWFRKRVISGGDECVEHAAVFEIQFERSGHDGMIIFVEGRTGTVGESAVVVVSHCIVFLLYLSELYFLLERLGKVLVVLPQMGNLSLHQLVLLLQGLHLHIRQMF
jgi:hypothetical protein